MGSTTSAIASGISTRVIAYCAAVQPLDCRTIFTDATNTSVAFFGDVAFGTFQADPDIAGTGTVASFVATSALLLLISLLLIAFRIYVLRLNISMPDSTPHPTLLRYPIPRPRPEPYKASKAEKRIKSFFSTPRRFSAPRSPRGQFTQTHSVHAFLPPQPPPINQHSTPQSPYVGQFTQTDSRHAFQSRQPDLIDHNMSQSAAYQPPEKGTYALDVSEPLPSPSLELSSEKIIAISHNYYDMVEAALFWVSDGQILLALAFSLSFLTSAQCSTSQYHLKIGLSLWLTAATNGVLAFAVVRRYFRSPLAGLFRAAALITSLIFSLGIPLIMEVNSGFASEIQPPNDRINSQIFLKAMCFMDPSFRQDVVADQINNYAIIGQSTTNPGISEEYVSWITICIVASLITVGRFVLRVKKVFQDKNTFDRENDRSKFELAYWCFLLLVWSFAMGIFAYRTKLMFDIRQWVAQSQWLLNQGAEERLQGFGQFASIVSVGAIVLAVLDRHEPKGEEVEE